MRSKIFRTAFARLADAGVIPNNGSGSDDENAMPLVKYVSGYQPSDLGLAFCVGGLFTVLMVIVIPSSFGYRLENPVHQRFIDAGVASGVDMDSLSVADIRGRLSYTPEQGRMIVEALTLGRPNFIEDTATALNQISIERRQFFMRDVIRVTTTFVSSEYKHQFLDWCLSLDDDTARRVVGMKHEIAPLLDQLTLIPSSDRNKVIAAGFPIRPLDYERAEIWRYLNSPEFPAAALVRPMAALAVSDPAALLVVYNYIVHRRKMPHN